MSTIRILAAFLCTVALACAADRWRIQYSWEENFSSLFINDFQFRSPRLAIAVGYIDQKGKNKPASVVSADGGAHWSLVPLKEEGLAVFFLDDTLGWLVTAKSLWKSEDGAKTWRRLKAPKDIIRVYFLTPERGWAVAARKQVFQTTDGGSEWTPLAAAAEPSANPEYSTYSWIEFADPNHGIITGSSVPPRRGDGKFPDWMEPESRTRRQWPSVSLELETSDGGRTWKSSSASIFGEISRVRLSPAGKGLAILEFAEAFSWPSEVHLMNLRSGADKRVLARKDRLITDAAIPSRGPAYLAGIEPVGKLSHSPIPGKVKILKSEDLSDWSEMEVDYRATANRVFLSSFDERNVWAATDTGMILKMP